MRSKVRLRLSDARLKARDWVVVGVHTAALPAGDLAEHAETFQQCNRLACRGRRQSEQLGSFGNGQDGFGGQVFEQPDRGNGRSVVGDKTITVPPNERMKGLRDANPVVGSLAHAPEEEGDPAFPITFAANGRQPSIVLLLLTPERQAEVQQRLLQ